MNFAELEARVYEDVLLEKESPLEIAAEVAKMMDEVKSENVFAVRRLAGDIAAAIRSEVTEYEDAALSFRMTSKNTRWSKVRKVQHCRRGE